MLRRSDSQSMMEFSGASDTECLGTPIYILAYCTGRRCRFAVVAEEVFPHRHTILRHFPHAANPVHRLSGETLTLEEARSHRLIEQSRDLYVDTDWPKCPHCTKRVIPCQSCGRLVCAIRRTGDGPLDFGHITVETCPLCHQTFLKAR